MVYVEGGGDGCEYDGVRLGWLAVEERVRAWGDRGWTELLGVEFVVVAGCGGEGVGWFWSEVGAVDPVVAVCGPDSR